MKWESRDGVQRQTLVAIVNRQLKAHKCEYSVYGVYLVLFKLSKRMKEKYKVTSVAVSLLIFDDMFEWNLEVKRDTVFNIISAKHITRKIYRNFY